MIRNPEGYALTEKQDSQASIYQMLVSLTEKTVLVWTGIEQEDRTSFEPSICVSGTLEQHETDYQRFRVLVNNGTYCYFKTANVSLILVKSTGFKDQESAVIRIEF